MRLTFLFGDRNVAAEGAGGTPFPSESVSSFTSKDFFTFCLNLSINPDFLGAEEALLDFPFSESDA